MKEVDFIECSFINKEMTFLDYNDFCNNCTATKRLYNSLTTNGKRFYKWYVYAHIRISEIKKDTIWHYLNYDDEKAYENLMFRNSKTK